MNRHLSFLTPFSKKMHILHFIKRDGILVNVKEMLKELKYLLK